MLRQALAEVARVLPPFKGRDRVLSGLIGGLSAGEAFSVRRNGVDYEVRGRDLIDYYLMSRPLASPKVTGLLIRMIGDRSLTYWDIGANIGSVLLPVLSHCPNARAVGFEPSPSVAGRLLRNLALNPELQSRCTILPTALTDATGWVSFFPSNEPGNSGVGGLAAAGNRQSFGPQVLGQRADDVAQQFGFPDVIKIDVEGFEPEVLSGFGEILQRDCFIVFEHHQYRLAERGLPKTFVPDFLQKAGFEIHDVEGGPADYDRDCDLVAVRGSWRDVFQALKVA
jgi:FkbM family methyltransferase